MATTFADSFLWGTATAAHQTEGGNWNSDWWAWEHAPNTVVEEPSGDACDHYWRYPQDLDLLVDLGFRASRFSIEWSRIEPEDGEWVAAAAGPLRRCDRRMPRPRAPAGRHVPSLHDASVGRR